MRKKILFIATGGTIASKKSENGLAPQISPEELLAYIPMPKRYNAFSVIDYPFWAVIQDGQIMRYIPMQPYEEEVCFYDKLNENTKVYCGYVL